MKRIIMSAFTIFAVVASVAGATHAVFSDTAEITGNTVSSGTVEINVVGGAWKDALNYSNLVPGEWTHENTEGNSPAADQWHRNAVVNDGSVPVRVFAHLENVTGDHCDQFNLQMRGRTNTSTWNDYHLGTVDSFEGVGNRIQVSADNLHVEPGQQARLYSRVQLDSGAPNDAQGETCTWETVFTAESIIS